MPHAEVLARHGRRVEIALDGDVNPLLRFLAGQEVEDLLLVPPRLEDIFMGFYGDDRSGGPNGYAADRLPAPAPELVAPR